MSSGFPLVRAADIAPFIRWMRANGRPIDRALASINLSVEPWEMPDRPVPLNAVLAAMRSLGVQEGPDIACRVVSESSIADLGVLGEVMLGGNTPREALANLCAAIPRHSTHEQFTMVAAPGGVVIREQLMLDVDGETLHIVQQYVAALIRALCRMTGFRGEPLGRIEIAPHPSLGLAHLERALGPKPLRSACRVLSIFLPDEVLDRPFQRPRRKFGNETPHDDWAALEGEKGYASTAKIFIEAMLDDETPSVERFAAAIGVSLRTVQRRLAANGTSFSTLLDDVRRDRALKALRASSTQIGFIAADLGYSDQPAFVRAMRRWAGVTPKQFRKQDRARAAAAAPDPEAPVAATHQA